MNLEDYFVFAQMPTNKIKDRVQLVLVLQNGDLRAVDSFDLTNQEEEKRLKQVVLDYEGIAPGGFGPHGRFEDYKFFWTDTNGLKTEMNLSLKLREGKEDGENLPN